jgi:hypothetical protein
VFSPSRVSVEIKDIDPLEHMTDLKQDIARGLEIKDASAIEVKSLRVAPWDTQAMIAVVPVLHISGKDGIKQNKNWPYYCRYACPPQGD